MPVPPWKELQTNENEEDSGSPRQANCADNAGAAEVSEDLRRNAAVGGDAGERTTRMAAGQRQADVRNDGNVPAQDGFCGAAGFARTDFGQFDYLTVCTVSAGTSGAGKERTAHRDGMDIESKELDFVRVGYRRRFARCAVVAESGVRTGEIIRSGRINTATAEP